MCEVHALPVTVSPAALDSQQFLVTTPCGSLTNNIACTICSDHNRPFDCAGTHDHTCHSTTSWRMLPLSIARTVCNTALSNYGAYSCGQEVRTCKQNCTGLTSDVFAATSPICQQNHIIPLGHEVFWPRQNGRVKVTRMVATCAVVVLLFCKLLCFSMLWRVTRLDAAAQRTRAGSVGYLPTLMTCLWKLQLFEPLLCHTCTMLYCAKFPTQRLLFQLLRELKILRCMHALCTVD